MNAKKVSNSSAKMRIKIKKSCTDFEHATLIEGKTNVVVIDGYIYSALWCVCGASQHFTNIPFYLILAH